MEESTRSLREEARSSASARTGAPGKSGKPLQLEWAWERNYHIADGPCWCQPSVQFDFEEDHYTISHYDDVRV